MKNLFINFLFAAALVFGSLFVVQAQSATDKSISEVKVLREKLITAISERDQKTLNSLYAEDFTHTHASGQVDDKTRRIAALVSGEQTIESAQVNEINIRIYNKTSAIAVGKSTIEAVQYRWTLIYIKLKKQWQIAASQATRIAEK